MPRRNQRTVITFDRFGPRVEGDGTICHTDVTSVTARSLSRVVERRQLIVELSGRRPSSSKTMTTFSDGGDGLHISNMAGLSPHSSSSGDMRFHLQTLLDTKEKQLQQAGTLGQQLLAQRMELEERIRQLQEFDLDDLNADADDLDVSVRERYRDLADTIKAWDAENEQLTGVFASNASRALQCLLSHLAESTRCSLCPMAHMLLLT